MLYDELGNRTRCCQRFISIWLAVSPKRVCRVAATVELALEHDIDIRDGFAFIEIDYETGELDILKTVERRRSSQTPHEVVLAVERAIGLYTRTTPDSDLRRFVSSTCNSLGALRKATIRQNPSIAGQLNPSAFRAAVLNLNAKSGVQGILNVRCDHNVDRMEKAIEYYQDITSTARAEAMIRGDEQEAHMYEHRLEQLESARKVHLGRRYVIRNFYEEFKRVGKALLINDDADPKTSYDFATRGTIYMKHQDDKSAV
ncbi:MAG: hypothetical protein AAF065_12990, partial [Verrucomicrobiota bacterium]